MSWDDAIAKVNAKFDAADPTELMESAEFLTAVMCAVKGNKDPLVALLKSERELRQRDRDLLARFINGDLGRRRGRPRARGRRTANPSELDKQTELHRLAHQCVDDYKKQLRKDDELREMLRKKRKKYRDEGMSFNINEFAMDEMVEFFQQTGLGTLDRSQLANLVLRSKQPRKK